MPILILKANDFFNYASGRYKSKRADGLFWIDGEEVESPFDQIITCGYYGEDFALKNWTLKKLHDNCPIELKGEIVAHKRQYLWQCIQNHKNGRPKGPWSLLSESEKEQRSQYYLTERLIKLAKLSLTKNVYVVYASHHSKAEAEMLVRCLEWLTARE